MSFSFSTARIVFGLGVRADIAVQAARLGSHCLLVTGGRPGRCDWLLRELNTVMDSVHAVSIGSEPETGIIAAKAAMARSEERRVGKECRSRWSPYH